VPELPTVESLLSMSCQVWIPDRRLNPQTLTSFVTLPTQPKFCASNCPLLAPSRVSTMMPREKVPSTVPSLGAAL
jgi:hypothetical protein